MPVDADIRTCLEAALRATQTRQSAIANNIANLNTPGYRRRVVQFEELFAKALQDGKVDARQLRARLSTPMSTPVDERGNDVDLDQEIGDLVTNTAAYKTYMRLLAKVYRQMDLAMGG
jgi:flagellar basal-body rod protein FlgB